MKKESMDINKISMVYKLYWALSEESTVKTYQR